MKRQIYDSVKEKATFISICFVALAAMFAVAPPSLAQQPLGIPRRPPLQLPPDAPGQTKTDPAARTQQPKVGVAVQERINRNLNRKPFHKPSDPEAAALLLNLIARYAADVPDKTDLDRRIDHLGSLHQVVHPEVNNLEIDCEVRRAGSQRCQPQGTWPRRRPGVAWGAPSDATNC